jgi:deoxyribodipyrimidine photo-lyase
MSAPILVLMTNTLRLADNPALVAAANTEQPVIPVFILDEQTKGARIWGGAARWWLQQSIEVLATDMKAVGSKLILRIGATADVMASLVEETAAEEVYLTRGYTPAEIAAEQSLHDILTDQGKKIRRFGGNLLLEPEMVRTKTGGTYTVFSPFWRTASQLVDTTAPLSAPEHLTPPEQWPHSDPVDAFDLAPKPASWAEPLAAHWEVGETAAMERLSLFLDDSVENYKVGRDLPGVDGSSSLSAYLAFGQISPRQIWYHSMKAAELRGGPSSDMMCYLREIGWRDFCTHLLFHRPEMTTEPLQQKFTAFPWYEGQSEKLTAWQKGLTGFPIVDAGMRQLWQTGWMHNRVRMIVASFLVKDLLWHWKDGEAWFWDTLVDAHFGNNIANWQWVAGCGADAAPYFRIFNPIMQGQKFDKNGDYVRRFVPELSNMPDKYIHAPFEAPKEVLQSSGITLGKTYPKPIIDRKVAREKALAALASIKGS